MPVVIHWVSTGLREVLDLVVYPLAGLDPVWALALLSLLTGLAMLWIYSRFSDQTGIRSSKDKIRGYLLGVRLFQHDVRVVLGLQARILRETLTYFRHSLTPLAIMLLPLVLVVTQLYLLFGQRPLQPGTTTLLRVQVDAPDLLDRVSLEASPALEVEAGPVRVSRTGEAVWRVKPRIEGRHSILIRVGERRIEKEVYVGTSWGMVSSLRTSDWLDLLLYSGESPLDPEAGVRAVELVHPPQEISLAGWRTDWLVCFLIFSMVTAFGCKGFFGVEL
jgi:hypothetical protein